MRYKGVVFSGLPGAGKSALVNKLVDEFKWEFLSAGGLWRQNYQKLHPDQKITFEEYWRGVPLDEKRQFAAQVDQRYSKGGIIGDSRYNINLRPFPLLLVFITADLETRASRAFSLGKYGKSSLDEIKTILAVREQDELKTGIELFNYDYRDANYYHLVINSSKLEIEEEAALIAGMVKFPEL